MYIHQDKNINWKWVTVIDEDNKNTSIEVQKYNEYSDIVLYAKTDSKNQKNYTYYHKYDSKQRIVLSNKITNIDGQEVSIEEREYHYIDLPDDTTIVEVYNNYLVDGCKKSDIILYKKYDNIGRLVELHNLKDNTYEKYLYIGDTNNLHMCYTKDSSKIYSYTTSSKSNIVYDRYLYYNKSKNIVTWDITDTRRIDGQVIATTMIDGIKYTYIGYVNCNMDIIKYTIYMDTNTIIKDYSSYVVKSKNGTETIREKTTYYRHENVYKTVIETTIKKKKGVENENIN